MRISNKVVYAMFTRIPTFIPTSPENVNEMGCSTPVARQAKSVRTKNGTGDKTSGHETVARRRKKPKTHALRKRIGTMRSEEKGNMRQKLPAIIRNDPKGDEVEILAVDDELGESNNKRKNRNSVSQRIPSPFHATSNNILRPNDSRLTGSLNHSPRGVESTDEEIAESEILIDNEMLTQPKLHKRNRRKLIEEPSFHASETKRHAREHIASVRDSVEVTENLDRESSRLSSTQGSRAFRSRIPVRFPNIQEQKTKSKHAPVKESDNTSLPPIFNSSLRSGNTRSGKVTQSILDYQNILENDFKRLGENLDNTFKLLHQYIQRSRNAYN